MYILVMKDFGSSWIACSVLTPEGGLLRGYNRNGFTKSISGVGHRFGESCECSVRFAFFH